MLETIQKLDTHPLSPAHSLDRVVNSDAFNHEREHGSTVELALSKAAIALAELDHDSDDTEARLSGDVMTLLGNLGDFIHGTEGMRHSREVSKLNHKEARAHKARQVAFNHAVRRLIEHDPSVEMDTIVKYLSDMHGVLNQSRWREDAEGWRSEQEWFKDQIECTLRGMQHELFAKQAIDSLHGFTADNEVSVNDDLNGVDLFVTYEGVRFPVDIKASPFAERNGRRSSRTPEHIMWSGVNAHKAGKRFTLKRSEAENASRYLEEQLKKAHAAHLKNQQSKNQRRRSNQRIAA